MTPIFFKADGSTILNMYCAQCDKNTPHKEDIVVEPYSSTVWHCLVCGYERPPHGGNAPVLAGSPRQGFSPSGAELKPLTDKTE